MDQLSKGNEIHCTYQQKMNIEHKPHPHSIESILGLTNNREQNVQSFRPYCKVQEESLVAATKFHKRPDNPSTRLIPRSGLLPRAPVLLRTEEARRLYRCGFQTQQNNSCEKIDPCSFRSDISRRGNENSTSQQNTMTSTAYLFIDMFCNSC